MIALNNPVKPNLKKLQKLLEKINDNSWFTNFGPMHKELTEKLEDYLCVENLLLTNNGTSALQSAGRALNSHSLISTPFSFVATVSAFKWQKDEVAFADIDSSSLNICPDAIKAAYEQGCKADTLVATHVYGNPCDVLKLKDLGEQKDFKIIYDAAHAFGVKINEQSILKYGDASTLSFHATKVFHTVEGGAVIFKDKDSYERAERLINFGSNPSDSNHVGINAKMNEYQAAVGLVNLEEIDDVLDHRAELFHAYRQGLKDVVKLPTWHPEANANGAYMPILLDSEKQLKKVTQALEENNIQSRNYFAPSLDRIFVDEHNYGTSNSLKASESILCLPLHAHLKLHDITTVIENVKKGL